MWVSMSVSVSVGRMGTHNDRAHRAETLPPHVPSAAEHASGRVSWATHHDTHGRHRRAHRSRLRLWAADCMDAHRGAADPADSHGRAHRMRERRWRTDHHARREGEADTWLGRRHRYARRKGHAWARDRRHMTGVPHWTWYDLSWRGMGRARV
jgi:hypothetical protein